MDTSALHRRSFDVRRSVVRSLAASGSGHLGGSLGITDILTYLYCEALDHDPAHPEWEMRDRLVLSAGHLAPALYASLAHAGYFPVEELLTLRKHGTRLQGHPGREHGLPGIELSAGSLGQGLSVSVGMALADRLDHKNRKVVCLMGDGELQEGSVWEAAMSAAHHRLSSLIAIVDRNGVQIDGPTEQVMALEPLCAKWEAFGWKTIPCDGHDFRSLDDAFLEATSCEAPSVLVATTTMGRGVASIEGDYRWHGKAPAPGQENGFLLELEESYGLRE